MVRYAQFCELPCDPTPQQSIQFEQEYKNIKGMLSIKSLTTKIEPLFVQNLEETAKIYSLAVNGTHADFLLTKNRLKYKMQIESINELTNLSEYLTYKTQEFKQLETALKANLEEEFRNFVSNIQASLNKIYNQYRQTLKNQFQVLKQETEKQTKIIQTELKRLERELDRQSLKRRKLNEGEIAQIVGISREEMFGYSTLFRIVSTATLEELESEQKSQERQISIDSSKIKRINCNQLWYLMELIKKKKDKANNPDENGSTIFLTDEKPSEPDEMKRQTIIERSEVLNTFEEQTFKAETQIIQELSHQLSPKKSKNLNDAMLNNSSLNDSSTSEITSLLSDFFKDKQMKSLLRSVEAKIQAEFVNFNERFNFKHFIENKAMKNKKKSQRNVEVEDAENVEEKEKNQEKYSVQKKYQPIYQPILQEIEKKEQKQIPVTSQPKKNVSPPAEIGQRKQQTASYSVLDGKKYESYKSYTPENIQRPQGKPQSPRFGNLDRPQERNASKDKTIIDKLQRFRQNRMNQFEDRPLISYPESYQNDEFSQINYQNESNEERKKQAEEQYSEYIQRMKKQQGYDSEKQRRQREEEMSLQEIKRIQEEEQKEKYRAYQQKLAQEEELVRFKEKQQREKEKEKQIQKRQKQRQKEKQREQRQKQRQRLRRQWQRLGETEERQKERQRQKDRQLIREKQREWEQQKLREKYEERQRQRKKQMQKQKQRERERQLEKQREKEREKEREREKQRENQELRQFARKQKINELNSIKQVEPVYKPDFFKKDLESSRVVQEWKQNRRKLQQEKLPANSLYGEAIYDSRGNLIRGRQEERTDDTLLNFLDIPGVDMEQQRLLMQEFENKKPKLPNPDDNVLLRKFKQQIDQPFYPTGKFQQEREYEKPYQGNIMQDFGFGDYYREKEGEEFEFEDYRKEQQADDSLLQFAMKESLNDTSMKKKKSPLDYIKPVGKFLANTFTNVIVPNFAPVMEKKLEETIDNTLIDFQGKFFSKTLTNAIVPNLAPKVQRNFEENFDYTLIDFEEFLSGMGKKKETFSLEQNFKYEVDDVEAFQFLDGEEQKIEKRVFPANTGRTRGQMSIKEINRQAEQLNATKQEFSIFVKVLQPVLMTFKPRDRQKNRPMTKLIVGDSTGIGILYMNYYFEVKAGCCLRLNNCRLHKYCNSFEINHHRNITIRENVREGSAIPLVDYDLILSQIRKVEAGKYIYDIKHFFNHPLSHCISEFSRNKMTIGEILLRKPIIVSVCDVTMSTRKCVIGDYTGRVMADLSNLKKNISLDTNDTLLIRNARMQINRGDILLLSDAATIVVKADKVLKFSHDMKYIPNKILKGNMF